MADDAKVTISDNISSSIAKKIAGIGAAARAAHSDVEILKKALKTFSAADTFKSATANARTFTSALRGTAAQVTALSSQAGTAAARLQALNQGARAAANGLNHLGQQSQRTNRNLISTSNASRDLLGTLAAFVGIRAFVTAADDATIMANKIKTITETQEEFNSLQRDLFNLANSTRSSVQGVTDSFVRYSKVLKPLGDSQSEIIRFTEILIKGFKAAGKTTSEATSGVIQLAQGLQSGRLAGDELKSVLENMPIEITNALAKSLNVSVGELRDLGAEGKITVDVIRDAISSAGKQIDELFARTTGTIGDALTVLNNKFVEFMSTNQGAASFLAGAILFIGDNLNVVIPIVLAFGTAWAVVQIANIVRDVFLLVRALHLLSAAQAILSVATAPITLQLLALAGAVLGVAYGIAFLTGNVDELNAFLYNLPGMIGGVVNELIGIGTASAASADQVSLVGSSIQSVAASVQPAAAAFATYNEAIKSTGTSSTNAAVAANQLAVNYAKVGTNITQVSQIMQATWEPVVIKLSDSMQLLEAGTQMSADSIVYLGDAAVKSKSDIVALGTDTLPPIKLLTTEFDALKKPIAQAGTNVAILSTHAAQAATTTNQLAAELKGVDANNISIVDTQMELLGETTQSTLGFVEDLVRALAKAATFNINDVIDAVTGGGKKEPSAPGFARGFEGKVGGRPGVDKNMIRFRASRGETLSVKTKAQQREDAREGSRSSTQDNRVIHFNVYAADADSFRRSRAQVANDFAAVIGG